MQEEKTILKSDVRKDFLGRGVVITVARGSRPHDEPKNPRVVKAVPPGKCFFCPGNERLTPPEIDRVERAGKWEIRCFPNKFPAFMAESKNAYGRHEIIVETPDHQKTLSELSEENLSDYLLVLKKRMLAAQEDAQLRYTCVFKNEGIAAGASLEHSHSQLVSMKFVPPFAKKLGKKAGAFAKLAARQPKTTFAQNGEFFAFCPKASRFHFEAWIVPKQPMSSLAMMDERQIGSLAGILKTALGAIDAATGFGPYNISFHSAPHGESGFPFHVQILPRLSTWAGFEFASEMVMISFVPEEASKHLASLVEKRK